MIFIFHRKKYIAESIAKALGYSDDSYSPFHKPEDLIARLKENPTLLFLNGDFPEDLKHILNEVFGGIKANNTPILIFSLSNQKSLINANKNGFKELQECIDKGLLDYIHLPFDQIGKIKDKIVKQKNVYKNNHKQREEMWKKVAGRIAEEQDISQRHINKNLQAAQRILNGALRSGDYNLLEPAIENKARECYKQLISADSTAKENEINEAMKLIDRAKNAFASSPAKEEWHKHIKKILVIDDQKEMWKPVWKFILGENEVDIVEDGEKGLDKIINGGQYDCVLLDIDLGKDKNGIYKENGIEVLQRIKHAQFDMPVIMMTAYDDAEVTKAGLQYGATNYFVKEIVDISDRNSVDYYNKFKEIIRFPYHHKLQRKIWSDYKNLESKISSIDLMWSTFIGKHLKKAYFFLTLDSDFLLPKQLLLSQKRDNYSDVVLNIEFALYQISSVLYAYNNKRSLDDAIEYLIRSGKKNAGSKVRYPSVIEIIEKSFNKRIKDADSLNKILIRARHNRSKVRKDDAIAIVELAIKYSDELIQNLRINKQDATKKGFTKKEFTLNTNIRELRNSFLSHEEISVKGAEVLKKGFESSGSIVINSDVLFIDDEGSRSAWYPLLNSIFYKVTVFERIENIPKEKNLNDYDLILLDLNLYPRHYNKGCKKGLETLSAIKEIIFTIPVIMLTATNSSYYTKKAFLKGAFDYFTKDTVLDPVSYWNQFNNIIQKALKIKNDEKELWGKFLNLTSLIERIKTSNTKLKNYLNNINESIYAPLKSAFFHYILISREHNLPEIYTIEKLITGENPKNDFLLLCGTAIEGLMNVFWKIVNPKKSIPDTGLLVKAFSDPALSKNFTKIWEYRTKSKGKSMKIEFKKHLVTSLESVTRVLTHADSARRYYFNGLPNSGHENKKRTVSRNQNIRTASNKPRNFDKTSKTKKLKGPQSNNKQRGTKSKKPGSNLSKGLIKDPEKLKEMIRKLKKGENE